MTVIGEAYIQIKGMVDGGIQKSLSGVEGDLAHVGDSAEHNSGRARAAFKQLGSSLAGAFGPAFEPIAEITEKFSEIESEGGKLKDNIGKMALGIGGAMTAAGTAITVASDKDKVANKQLQQSVENAGGSWEKYKEETEVAIKSQEHYGHTAVETQNVLTNLVTKTKNVSGAYENMQLVSDLAAQKGISLASAGNIVAKVMNGQTRTLKQYGINADQLAAAMDHGAYKSKNFAMQTALTKVDTDKEAIAELALRDAHIKATLATTTNADEQKKLQNELKEDALKHAELSSSMSENRTKAADLKKELGKMASGAEGGEAGIKLLSERLKGQASIAADTFTGKMKAVKARIEDFVGVVGQKVGPVLQTAGPVLMGFGAIIETGVVQKFGKGLKALLAWDKESRIVQALTKVWTGIQWAFDAAMDANPIVLVVAAIVALGAAVYLAYTHFKPFRDLIDTIGRALKGAFFAAIHGAERVLDGLVDFFRKLPGRILDGIKNIGKFLWNGISSGFNWLKGKITGIITDVVNFFRKLPGQVVRGIGNLGRTIWNGISAGFDWVKTHVTSWLGNLVSNFLRWPTQILHAIGNVGSKIWQNISNGFATMKSRIMDWVGNVVNFFTTFPVKVMHAIGNLGSQIWGGITSGLSAMRDKVMSWAHNVASWFGNLPGMVVRTIGNLGGAIWNGISSGLSSLFSRLRDKLSGIKDSVLRAVSNAGSWLLDAGRQMVQGFINGITGMFGDVASAAGHLVSNLGGKVLHVLGIGSPSKVYHEIGRNVARGLILGLQHSEGDVARAGISLANAAMHDPNGMIHLPMGMNAAGVGAGSRVINLFPNAHIDFGKQSPAHIIQSLESALRAGRF
jgi:hypothetical protein